MDGDSITPKNYNGTIRQDDERNASVVETEIVADYDDSSVLYTVVTRLDYPEPMQPNGFIISGKNRCLIPASGMGFGL